MTKRKAVASAAEQHDQQQEAIQLPLGLGIDQDDYQYRRLTSGAKFQTRDLSPLTHDRQLEVSWYLFEQNPFAHRLIVLMTDLVIGEGVNISVTADDERIQDAIDQFWQRNQLDRRMREFYVSNALNGELIFPAVPNPVSGIPVLGFIDPAEIRAVRATPDNILVPDVLVIGSQADQQLLKVIRENPQTGKLEGDVFFHAINKLPNSMRGRSDLLPLADWLDLYDQFMFAEVERLNLISAFAWDYTIEDATPEIVAAKVKALPRLKPGAVFGHNQKERLEPRTPDLKATDRSEVARMLRTHIAGSMGFPISYLGEVDSNRATIEGQNDVLLKTPASRQKEFAGFLHQIVTYVIQQAVMKNPALYREAAMTFRVTMPEIAAKDVARVGAVIANVVSALDTAIANKTMSRRSAVRVVAGLLGQLGVEMEPDELLAEIESETDEAADLADLVQAELARQRMTQQPPPGPPQPPPPDDDDTDDEGDTA